MRAHPLRRLAVPAALVAGLSLTGFAVHGVSRVDTTLRLAADRAHERSVLVGEGAQRWDCDRGDKQRRAQDRRV